MLDTASARLRAPDVPFVSCRTDRGPPSLLSLFVSDEFLDKFLRSPDFLNFDYADVVIGSDV